MNTIYIVVLVTYDYFRFQNNLYASLSKEDCLKFIEKENKKEHNPMPVYEYKNENSKKADKLCASETRHFWIQKF